MRKKMLSFMLCGMVSVSLVGCGNKGTGSSTTATPTPVESTENEGTATEAVTVQIGQVYAAAHGTKCFTIATAVVQGDVIVDAYVDEFQFFASDAGMEGVPNSDSDLAASFAEGNVLVSKRVNSEAYSALLAEKAGSTVTYNDNIVAIQNYAIGKTIAEVEADAQSEGISDAVSGATLVDTPNYLAAIVEAAKAAQQNEAVEYTGDVADLELKVAYGAAHGTKCFTIAAAVTGGDTVVLSYLDEIQALTAEDGVIGLPNSDADFAAGFAEGVVLASKRVNTEYYSKMMAEKANSTVAIDANFDAIQNHVDGMTISEITEFAASENPVDAISGATLADTANYAALIAETAQK